MSGQHSRVHAVSHSASFDKKANVIRAIEAAMDESIDQQASIVYPAVAKDSLQRAQSSPRKGDSLSIRMGLINDRAGIPLSQPQLPTVQQYDTSRKNPQITNYSSILI